MKLRVLVVDDDEAVRRTIRDVLAWSGFEVTAAASASEALTALQSASFDAVVTDMRMETHTSGYDVIAAARAGQPQCVRVILSAHPIPAPEWRAGGADAAFVKGGSIFDIIGALKDLIAFRRQQRP